MPKIEIEVDDQTASDVEALETFFHQYVREREAGRDGDDAGDRASIIAHRNRKASIIHCLLKDQIVEKSVKTFKEARTQH